MGLGRRRGEQQDHNRVEAADDEKTISSPSSPIQNAVFCVRGGGANGPCIGIDLGKLMKDPDNVILHRRAICCCQYSLDSLSYNDNTLP